MNYGFAFVLIAFGGSLFYKGYKGWTWQQFYSVVLQGGTAPTSSSAAVTPTAGQTATTSGSVGSKTNLFGTTPNVTTIH